MMKNGRIINEKKITIFINTKKKNLSRKEKIERTDGRGRTKSRQIYTYTHKHYLKIYIYINDNIQAKKEQKKSVQD